MSQHPAVFLDRDGTLNQQIVRQGKPYPPATLAEFVLYTDALESCTRLKAAGFKLVVVTNQPDVGRGTQQQSIVEEMHAVLLKRIPLIDRIEVCFAPGQGIDHPDNRRRKPAPGMLIDAARTLEIDLSKSWMVGDRWGDIDAGHAAGCRTVFIDWGYAERRPNHSPDYNVRDLKSAADIILTQTHLPLKTIP